MSIIANRLKNTKASPTLAISAKAREMQTAGIDVISLSLGEPDFITPENVKEKAIKAINDNKTLYTAVEGIADLKKAVVAKFARDNNLNYQLDQVMVSTGAKQVLFNALLSTVNPGDEIIIPAPYWVSYPDMVDIVEGKSVIINCPKEQNFKLSAGDLEAAISSKTKWLILNSPSNPTGNMYSYDELRALAEVLLKHNHVYILSDDIYEHVNYGEQEFCTIASVEPKLFDRTVTVNGLSKSHAMTGWRVGYAGGPKEIIKAMTNIQSQSTSNPCSISQYAALEALTAPMDFIKERNDQFKKRRDIMADGFNKIPGVTCLVPEGAFYLFPDFNGILGRKTPKGQILADDLALAKYLLEEARVAIVPGSAFGLAGFIRISYATKNELLIEAMKRITNAILALQ